jgi:hypothetical protein
MKAGLVVEAMDTQRKEKMYAPAIDVHRMNIGFIIGKLQSLGELKRGTEDTDTYHRIKLLYNQMEKDMNQSEANKNIVEL